MIRDFFIDTNMLDYILGMPWGFYKALAVSLFIIFLLFSGLIFCDLWRNKWK